MPPGYFAYSIILERNFPSLYHVLPVTSYSTRVRLYSKWLWQRLIGHYWQVFHFPCSMKDENLVGLCAEATISPADVVCNKQIEMFGYQFGTSISYELVSFRRKPHTYQSFYALTTLTIVRCLPALRTF